MKSLILVVDDDADCRFMMCEMLSFLGFNCIEARNGYEGVALALKEQPSMIFMDLVMPEFSGFSAIQTLQYFRQTRHIPIVILSSMADSLRESPVGVIAIICKGQVTLRGLKQILNIS
jgi:CheY-like chemotaxis protein